LSSFGSACKTLVWHYANLLANFGTLFTPYMTGSGVAGMMLTGSGGAVVA